MEFSSHPKVLTFGHRYTDALIGKRVIIQEKIDGSQLNWAWDADGKLHVRSKGAWQLGGPTDVPAPTSGMFKPAIDHLLQQTPRHPDLRFHGETLATPKHNVIAYERVPRGHIALFEVTDRGVPGVPAGALGADAGHADIDIVPVLWSGTMPADILDLDVVALPMAPSMLGGQPEGVVIRPVEPIFLPDGKPLVAKWVRPEFKEAHGKTWKAKKANPIESIVDGVNTEARWRKAIQRAQEDGWFTGEPKDIGRLMVAIKQDVMEEEEAEMQRQLWEAHKGQVQRAVGRGFPEWFKEGGWR